MMEKESKGRDKALNAFWKFFTSLRLTIVLLLSLAITSVIGTLIPQNQDPAAYRQAFGELGFNFLDFLGLLDMYHSWWFLLLLHLLVINIVVCSIQRLDALWGTIFTRKPKFSLEGFRSTGNRVEFKVSRNSAAMVSDIKNYLSKYYGYLVQQDGEAGTVFFAEKWRWSRIGVYVVHLSIVFLLIGAILGAVFGFDGYVNIPEGGTIRTIGLRGSGASMDLDFSVRCNDFNVSYYETGMPKEFRSSLTILEGDKEILTRDIIVNDPLRFRGINFFQSGYGEMSPSAGTSASPVRVTLDVTSSKTSQTWTLETIIGQALPLPEDLGTLQLKEFTSGYEYRGSDLGPTIVGTLEQTDGTKVEIILPTNYPTFDRMMQRMDPARTDAVEILLKDVVAPERRYFTGLQVTKDPGVSVVYAGFVLLLAGCSIAFFMSHQQVCIEVFPLKNNTRIAVSGKANKGKPAMRRQVEEIREKLQSISKRTAKEG